MRVSSVALAFLFAVILSSNIVIGIERKSLAGTSPMASGERRKFRFDSHYSACKLHTFFSKKFYIKKYIIEEGQRFNGMREIDDLEKIVFFAGMSKQNLATEDPNVVFKGRWLGVSICTEGEVDHVHTADENRSGMGKDAYRCGLATLLTYLCLVDRGVQGDWAGHDIEDEDDFIPQQLPIATMAKRNCKKLVYLNNNVIPFVGAKAYLYAAKDADYLKMATFHGTELQHHTWDTDNALKEFDELTKCGRPLGTFEKVYGNYWYFCMEK